VGGQNSESVCDLGGFTKIKADNRTVIANKVISISVFQPPLLCLPQLEKTGFFKTVRYVLYGMKGRGRTPDKSKKTAVETFGIHEWSV